jgi:hypothetical protein
VILPSSIRAAPSLKLFCTASKQDVGLNSKPKLDFSFLTMLNGSGEARAGIFL